ncbi:kinase-like domain-containing protein [Parachaetomium inaequale]|uniref:EKC/KEOPS complex subunit BUD32 n=1 Tax=Parachaetomium inaequale TaxID=2588326 RepID=A0AAN6ST80_9PEZI|nr:kinase-like domain-containing protein [Parachaetomium inaequale]
MIPKDMRFSCHEETVDHCLRAEENIDKVAADVVGILVDGSGNLTFVNEHELDENKSTWYRLLDEYQLPEGAVKTVLRSALTELDRLSVHVDLVSRPGLEKCVFKYTHHYAGCGKTYQELQIHARLPSHPNILPLDCLVLDELSGKRVVGFTAPFIAVGDLDTNKDRPFRLKHLKQLMEAVDYLNYTLGIVHHDMAPRNLFIDPATDTLVLFDFGVAAKIGYKAAPWERHVTVALEERNDVKGVVVTVHEILTRAPRYAAYPPLHSLDETDLLAGPEKWVKHPDVELDAGLDAVDYYNELMRWDKEGREHATEPAVVTIAVTTTNPDPTTQPPPSPHPEPHPQSNKAPPNPNTKPEQPENNNASDNATPVTEPRQAPKRPQPEAMSPTSSSAAAAATAERETKKTKKTTTKTRKRAGSAVQPEERGAVRRSPRLRARGRSMSPVVNLPN